MVVGVMRPLPADSATEAWSALSPEWRVAFEEAWTSWCSGSLAVGTVITDEAGTIVARGHNQILHAGPGPISHTYMAHAEMNALALLPINPSARYRLHSTLEPCSMCSSAIGFYPVREVRFATPDPSCEGMHDLLRKIATR